MNIIAEANKIIEEVECCIRRRQEAEAVFVTFVSAGQVIYNLYQRTEPMRVLFASMLETFGEKGFQVEKELFVNHYSTAIAELDQQKNSGTDEKDIREVLTLYFNCSVWGKAVK